MIERRRSARARVIYGGVIAYNGRQSTVDCVIRNFSPDGAKVEFHNAALLPDVAASLRGLYGAQIPGHLSLQPQWWIAGLLISVVGALLAEGHSRTIKLALANAFLTESQVLKVLAKPGVPERVVAAIAQHPRWAVQYNIRVALVRNQHTPIPVILAFLPNLTLRDLKDLATLEGLSPHVRRYIQKELSRRPGAK